MMGTILQDLFVAMRSFRRRRGFALLVSGTLALGIGAHAALFSVVDGVLLRPVDLPRSDELIVVRMEVDGELRSLTGPNAADLLEQGRGVLASAAAFAGASATIQNPDGSRETRAGVAATPQVFETLAVPLQLGRPWGVEAMGTGAVAAVVITDRLWRSRFGADTSAVGGTLLLNGTPVEVTGVTAPGFEFPTLPTADFVYPPVMDPATLSRAGLGGFTLLGRLEPAVPLDRAREELGRSWESIRAGHPADLLDHGIVVMGLQDYVVRNVRRGLLVLLGATSLLLVLACANASNLVLARGIGRSVELSIRASLGAGRGRLTRQLLVESALLAGAAGLAGVFLAHGALALVRSMAPPEIPRIGEAHLSVQAVAVALSVAAGCVLLVGVLPAWATTRSGLSLALRSGTRATLGARLARVQRALVVAQVAAAVVLTAGAGLLVQSFSALSSVDPGYRTEGVLTATVGPPASAYPDRSSRAAFYRRVEREVARLPGVQRVGTTFRAPFSTGEISVPLRLADVEGMRLEQAPRVELGIVSPGYIEALEIPLLRGRNFSDRDREESPRVALLSASLARALYGDEDPVGRRLAPVLGAWEDATHWAEVVGVVGDIRLESLDAAAVGTLYLSTSQMPQLGGTLVVQASGDPTRLGGPVRDALLRLEPQLLVPTIRTLASLRAEDLARPRFHSFLGSVLSVLALILAGVGIYGLLSYSVAARRFEIGIRVAFGADRSSVLRLVMKEGMRLAVLGLVLGVAGALLAGRAMSGLLFETAPTDATALSGTVLAVTAIALAAGLLPALRAARDDGLEVLRKE